MIKLIQMLVEKGYKPTFSSYIAKSPFEGCEDRIYVLQIDNHEFDAYHMEDLQDHVLWALDLHN